MTKNNNKSRKTVNIFGVKLVSTTKDEVLKQVKGNIDKKRKFLLFTPNPEIILEARKNRKLQDVINKADINIADGVGIKLAYNYLNKPVDHKNVFYRVEEAILLLNSLTASLSIEKNGVPFPIIKGRELFGDVVSLASKNKWKIYLLGGSDDVSEKTAAVLKEKYKNLKISYSTGPYLNTDAVPMTKKDKKIEKEVVKDINKFKPDILFVGFGAPKQELWSNRILNKLNTKGIMVVGGTFDYVSGKSSVPPVMFSELGLEWLWRLLTQPNRIKRIINAVIVYPVALYFYKLQKIRQ